MKKTIGVVNTQFGPVSGVELDGRYEGVTMFKSIPYAAPPVGELRWKAPVDPEPWVQVRECTVYGDICPQPSNRELDSEPYGTDFYYMETPKMSEDCLHLTVTTAAENADAALPVYVWFHGGGSDHGYSYEVEFDPTELALKGIVVVQVNHRLGAFGYMTLPQLNDENGHSGNYTLMDNIKALKWIVENIRAFGGDPEQITLGGQSAGCGKSASVAFSPYGREHVKNIINESWLNWLFTYPTVEHEHQVWAKFLGDVGLNANVTAEELRAVDAMTFVPQDRNVRIPGALVCDGNLVPNAKGRDSMEQFGGRFNYLSGNNVGETHIKPNAVWGDIGFETAQEFYDFCNENLAHLAPEADFSKLFPVTDENVDHETRKLAAQGLAKFKWGGVMINRHFGAYRKARWPEKKTFNYVFDRMPPIHEHEKGTARDTARLMAWHSSELWYAFHSLRDGVPPARPWQEKDHQLAEIMCSYWANFIKTGDPNGEGLPVWPESDESFAYIELGDEIVPHPGMNGAADEIVYAFVKQKDELPEI